MSSSSGSLDAVGTAGAWEAAEVGLGAVVAGSSGATVAVGGAVAREALEASSLGAVVAFAADFCLRQEKVNYESERNMYNRNYFNPFFTVYNQTSLLFVFLDPLDLRVIFLFRHITLRPGEIQKRPPVSLPGIFGLKPFLLEV